MRNELQPCLGYAHLKRSLLPKNVRFPRMRVVFILCPFSYEASPFLRPILRFVFVVSTS